MNRVYDEMDTMNKRPRVSVIMGVYNCERYVAEAIESILNQTYRDFEFIIIDDKSTDRSSEIISSYAKKDRRIKVVKNKKNLGLTRSLNIGLKIARGEFIARMDADDISRPRRLERQVAFLDKHEEIGLVSTFADIIDCNGKKIGEIKYATDDATIRRRMMERNQFIHPASIFRRSVEKVGGYDETFRSAQDCEFFPRIMTEFKAANLPEKLLKYRWDFDQNEGFTQSSKQMWNSIRARWRMIMKLGWPKWQAIYMIKPMISYCIPPAIKKAILRRFYKRK
jgi:glycosyltransferase involved in cell wall biosynthesis